MKIANWYKLAHMFNSEILLKNDIKKLTERITHLGHSLHLSESQITETINYGKTYLRTGYDLESVFQECSKMAHEAGGGKRPPSEGLAA